MGKMIVVLNNMGKMIVVLNNMGDDYRISTAVSRLECCTLLLFIYLRNEHIVLYKNNNMTVAVAR